MMYGRRQKVKGDDDETSSKSSEPYQATYAQAATVYFFNYAFFATILAMVVTIFIVMPQGYLLHGDNNDLCDDGNTCTVDFNIHKACQHWPARNGTPCTSLCYSTPTGDPTLPSYCEAGVCTGNNCAGLCTTVATCPSINGTTGLIPSCTRGICLYSGGYIPNVNSTGLGSPSPVSGSIFTKTCNNYINASNAYIPCLDLTMLLYSGNVSASIVDNVSCLWTFSCINKF